MPGVGSLTHWDIHSSFSFARLDLCGATSPGMVWSVWANLRTRNERLVTWLNQGCLMVGRTEKPTAQQERPHSSAQTQVQRRRAPAPDQARCRQEMPRTDGQSRLRLLR